jgi:hypothetical protein
MTRLFLLCLFAAPLLALGLCTLWVCDLLQRLER